ncbi:MAG TPA: AMP-binding protein, partial [Vicinamibacterales bacterium]|nr:AMP-binding protein [Vicinamibacterales bacterium]
MPRRTLIDFYADLSTIDGEFVVYDDGYRSWSYSYAQIAAASEAFGARLRAAGITRGQAVALWSENRAEWLVA